MNKYLSVVKEIDFYALPQALYKEKNIKNILRYENNCILYKESNIDLINKEKLITSHSIVYVINGRLRVNTYEGDEVIIQNGEMIFMPRDSYIISDYIKNNASMKVYLFFFDHNLALKFLAQNHTPTALKESNNLVCQLKVTQNIKYYISSLEKFNFKTLNTKEILELKLLELLYLLDDSNQNNIIKTLLSSESFKEKRDIESFMLEHYDKNLSINDFASLSGRSLSSFNRDFKNKYNTTPKKWLIKKKMNKAKTMLEKGASVSTCAFDLGYKNVSNFIKAYKSVYKLTPKYMQQTILLDSE